MHDYPDSVETLDEMLTKLQSRGFVFVVPDWHVWIQGTSGAAGSNSCARALV